MLLWEVAKDGLAKARQDPVSKVRSNGSGKSCGWMLDGGIQGGSQSQGDPRKCRAPHEKPAALTTEADAAWASNYGRLKPPQGVLWIGHTKRDWKGAAVCTDLHVRRPMHTACRPAAHGSALHLCHNVGRSPQESKTVFLQKKISWDAWHVHPDGRGSERYFSTEKKKSSSWTEIGQKSQTRRVLQVHK